MSQNCSKRNHPARIPFSWQIPCIFLLMELNELQQCIKVEVVHLCFQWKSLCIVFFCFVFLFLSIENSHHSKFLGITLSAYAYMYLNHFKLINLNGLIEMNPYKRKCMCARLLTLTPTHTVEWDRRTDRQTYPINANEWKWVGCSKWKAAIHPLQIFAFIIRFWTVCACVYAMVSILSTVA